MGQAVRAVFCGTGEAFDPDVPNTSVLLDPQSHPDQSLLLDCGFTAAHAFWRFASHPHALHGVWISHLHGDHFLGLPLMVLRFKEEGRTRPLHVWGGQGTAQAVRSGVELAYPGTLDALPFELRVTEVCPEERVETDIFSFGFASTIHSRVNLALRVDWDGGSLYYSGDGRPTESARQLARNVSCVVHEAYHARQGSEFHCSVPEAAAFASRAGARQLALVHLRRAQRPYAAELAASTARSVSGLSVSAPKPGDFLRFNIP